MRRIVPIVRKFRYQLREFDPAPLPRNWLFRRVLYLLRRLDCLLSCAGKVVEVQKTVSTTRAELRDAEPFAKATFVENTGANAVTIFEDGPVVAIIPAGQRRRMPVNGRLSLQARTDSGSTTLRVLTYRRCACGDTESPYDMDVVMPGGGDLV